MYLAVITRMTVRLLRFRNVKPRKICRPPGLQPIARKRCSCAECKSSSRTEMLSDEKSASISSMETPWFWHLAELPSSQSKPEMSTNMVWVSICTVICQYKSAHFQSNPFLNHRGRDIRLPICAEGRANHPLPQGARIFGCGCDVIARNGEAAFYFLPV